MGRISDRQREIIHMKYIQQLDYEDIARIMSLNYQSARNLVTRALAALRKEMTLILLILILLT
jgi:DNA-directed RNA polymerase specialized sigma24 family protein